MTAIKMGNAADTIKDLYHKKNMVQVFPLGSIMMKPNLVSKILDKYFVLFSSVLVK